MSIKQKNKKLIIVLLILIVLMIIVGYAIFSINSNTKEPTDSNDPINIEDTTNINNTRGIEITNIEILKKQGATDAAGSPAFDNSNGLTVSFNTQLSSPGDYETYKIEVTNKSSSNARLSNIELPENTNDNVIFYVNKDEENNDINGALAQNDILKKSGDVGYVYVTVLYKEYENQTTSTGEAVKATATINLYFAQTSDDAVDNNLSENTEESESAYKGNNSGVVVTSSKAKTTKRTNSTKTTKTTTSSNSGSTQANNNSGNSSGENTSNTKTIYRWNTKVLAIVGTRADIEYDESTSISELIEGEDYITEKAYPTYSSRAAKLGHQYYLKHTVEADKVIESYVCFISDTEHCLQGIDDASSEISSMYFKTNLGILKSEANMTWFNNSTIMSYPGRCTGDETHSFYCSGGDFMQVYTSDFGTVWVTDLSQKRCEIIESGTSYCY